jgi:CheY-like chemotaxis protein
MTQQAAKILVVDDVDDDRQIMRRRLVRAGFEVVEADSGEAALELLARSAFDLMMLDLRMPGLSGLDVLEALRGPQLEHGLPVIIVSVSDDPNDMASARRLQASAYLRKPVDFPLALTTVRAHLNAA